MISDLQKKAMATPFEAVDKKLEVCFSDPHLNLRVGEDRWRKVVADAGALILSSVSGPSLDAYLLSESSLFVWPDRVILMTCGQASPVSAIPALMAVSENRAPASVFYERKNLMFPTRETASFRKETALLADCFPGEAVRLGGADKDHVHFFSYLSSGAGVLPYLKVLMDEPEPQVMDSFDKNPGSADSKCRLFFQGMTVDRHFFTPTGYSMNGISGQDYATLHVTPQPGSAYASFETSCNSRSYLLDILPRLLRLFRPKRCSVVVRGQNPFSGEIQAGGYSCVHHTSQAVGKTGQISFSQLSVM